MAKNTVAKTREARRASRTSPYCPISFKPGKGLLVSTGHNPYPRTANHKILVAEGIVKAVVRAMDSEGSNADDLNFDPHWPLSMAVHLLSEASLQLEIGKAGAK